LVELIVVLAILGVVLAILIPAVQKVRAAASQLQCANNLKQMGLASYSASSEKGTFPPAFYFWPEAKPPSPMAGPLWHLLPYLEQAALYKSRPIVFDAAAPQLLLYRCPMDPTASGSPTTSYLLNAHLFNGFTRPNEITDGLSNTVSFTETYANCDGSNPVYWSNSGSATLMIYAPEGEVTFLSSPGTRSGSAGGCSATLGDNAQSAHAGCILTAMADGSVRTVSKGGAGQQASLGGGGSVTNWAAAFTPNSGEVLGSEW
jgi:type II secretory pathway pseudopilin PulG